MKLIYGWGRQLNFVRRDEFLLNKVNTILAKPSLTFGFLLSDFPERLYLLQYPIELFSRNICFHENQTNNFSIKI